MIVLSDSAPESEVEGHYVSSRLGDLQSYKYRDVGNCARGSTVRTPRAPKIGPVFVGDDLFGIAGKIEGVFSID